MNSEKVNRPHVEFPLTRKQLKEISPSAKVDRSVHFIPPVNRPFQFNKQKRQRNLFESDLDDQDDNKRGATEENMVAKDKENPITQQ